jgi:hypothetical protein
LAAVGVGEDDAALDDVGVVVIGWARGLWAGNFQEVVRRGG